MHALCREFDWAATPLGAVETWPQSLRTAAGTVLSSGFPCIVLWGPELVQIYNDGYRPLMGVKHPAGLGQPTRECWPEVWHINAPIYARVRRGETVTLEDQLYPLRRGGPDAPPDDVYLTISYGPVRDEAGDVAGVFITMFDVTARVLAEGARRDLTATLEVRSDDAESSRERLAAVLDQLPVGVIITEAPSGRAVVINDTLARIWGQRPETADVEHYSADWTGYHPDGRRVESHEWPVARAVLRGERVTGMLVEVERPDGARRWVEISAAPVHDAGGEIRVAVAVVADVTARRQAERERERLVRELEVERARLADVFRQAPSFLAVVRGPDFVFELVNDAYYQLVGHRTLLGKPALEALPEVRDQGFVELLESVVRTGEPFVGRELPIMLARTPESPPEERYLDFVYQPLVEADGTRSGVIAHGTDVTDQVVARREIERLLGESERARAEAEQARAEADAANRAKSEFLATMSHEIRTPINAIQGYAQLLDLGLGGAVTAQQRDYLSRLTTSSQHLLGLINDVLDLSKVEAGELSVSREPATTGTAVAAALDLIAPQAAARGVRIVDVDRGLPGEAYVGDEHRVRQVLVNLLSNAVKFTEPGGTVTVATGSANQPPRDAQLAWDGPWTYVRVEDTGVGIAPEMQTAVFEPFMQVESGHTRTKGGTGLGLAISRRLARLMGGDLTLQSTPGDGSTFTLWLPGAERVHTGWTAEMTAAQVAGARTSEVAARSLGELGETLRSELDSILAGYTERMRHDPGTPLARTMERAALEDHAVTLLADLAQSLTIAGEAGADAVALLRDGSGIQRVIAEHHGARRHSQGWALTAVRRDYQLLLEELDRRLRARRTAATPEAAAGALRMLVGLVERAAQASARSWRRTDDAEGEAQRARAGGGAGGPATGGSVG